MANWIFQKAEAWKQRNIDYYVRAFNNYERSKIDTFNYAAGLFPFLWFVYRKMYTCFFLSLILCTAMIKLLDMILFFKDGNLSSFVPDMCLMIFCCRFGNRWYYRTVRSRVEKGYHLIEKYNPISLEFAVLMLFAYYISNFLFQGLLSDYNELAILGLVALVPFLQFVVDHMKFHLKESKSPVGVDATAISQYLNKADCNYGVTLAIIIMLVFFLPSKGLL
ncbi:MAG: DUF2628 domain-containing protein [Alphaproteobacteria bacterium]|nr:DUF2628 domain-containing protein [Alphaproteobacteria bacterium]